MIGSGAESTLSDIRPRRGEGNSKKNDDEQCCERGQGVAEYNAYIASKRAYGDASCHMDSVH